jgi:serine/threonine-protein kinase
MATCPTCRTHYPDDVAICASDGDALVADDALEPELSPGTLVGEYRVEGKLGAGGFGTVYRAVHPVIGKAAAIKVLSRQFSANPQIVTRFIAEARAVNQIRHRNIIDIFSFGALEDGRHYYVMELLEGMPLDAYLKKRGGRIAPAEALPILSKVARALDAAHAAGIAHRDLKPENIYLVFDEDAGVFPKLLDFGIAKLLGDSSPGMHKTRSGMAMGTPLYMSPEQCRGKNVDHRTDIYSFGIMAHELLAGRPPFDADSAVDLLIKQTAEPPPPLSSVAPDLPAALDAPILRMLEKDPSKRPASVGEAMEALNAAARGAGIELGHVPKPSFPPAAGALMGLAPGRTAAAMAETQVADAAPTKPSSPHPTDMAVGTSVVEKSRAKRSPVMVALVALGGLAVIAGALVAMRSSSADTETKPEARVTAQEPAQGVATVAPTVAPVVSAPVVEAAAPAEVALTVETTPKGASIWRDGKQIGTAPGPINLPRGEKVKLTFKAPGYAPLEREIPAGTEGTVKVALSRSPDPPKGGVHKDLIPFE